MNQRGSTSSHVHAALEREPRINIHRHPIHIAAADGTVTLEGEVADVAAKRLASWAAKDADWRTWNWSRSRAALLAKDSLVTETVTRCGAQSAPPKSQTPSP